MHIFLMRSQVLLWSQLLSSEHQQCISSWHNMFLRSGLQNRIFARSDPTCPHSLHVSSPPPALVPTVAPRTAKLLHTFDHSSFPSVLALLVHLTDFYPLKMLYIFPPGHASFNIPPPPSLPLSHLPPPSGQPPSANRAGLMV